MTTWTGDKYFKYIKKEKGKGKICKKKMVPREGTWTGIKFQFLASRKRNKKST